MEHNFALISTIAAAFGVALIFGFIAEKLKLPALLGYLLGGIVIGPATPGFVADVHLASELAEIGVMLLMFGVGLHFSFKELMSVKRIAVPGAIVQMGVATVLGGLLAHSWGWSSGSALVFGLSLSCASTVVLLKALEARGILESVNGRIAVGWLVVEDLATVLILVLLPPLAVVLGAPPSAEFSDDTPLWISIGLTLINIMGFVLLMIVVGTRVMPWLLMQVAKTGSRELFTLMVIAAAIGIAFGAAELFHVSFALGAFFAGMVMRESELSHRAAEDSLPLRDAFSVLFFVSVGMLFEPRILLDAPLQVMMVVGIIIIGKALAAFLLVIVFRYPLSTGLTTAASLAQIGEFSFILAGLGLTLGLLPTEGMSLILAAALFSIALNPFVFRLIDPIKNWAVQHSKLAHRLEFPSLAHAQLPNNTSAHYLKGQVVLVGYGRVGKRIAQALKHHHIPFVIIEVDPDVVSKLRLNGTAAIVGNATDIAVLEQAHVQEATMLIIAMPDPFDEIVMIEQAKKLNPNIELVLRTHNETESELLSGYGRVFFGEEELAKGMSTYICERFSLKGV